MKRRSPHKSDVAAVEFVLTECVRINNEISKAAAGKRLRDLPRRDIFASIPHPSGNGEMMCGRDAYEQLRCMATAALENSPLARMALVEDVFKSLRQFISERFIARKVEVNETNVSVALADAVEAAGKNCANTTHQIPCRLMYVKDPEEFSVGPVTFRTQSAFAESMQGKFEAYADRKASATDQAFDQKLLTEARAYYEAFGWTAEVMVLGCAPEVSRQRAELAVKAAVNILSLLLGGYHTRKMAVGGHMLPEDCRAHMSYGDDGKLRLQTSNGSTSAVGFEKGWSEFLKRKDVAFLLEGADQALASIVNPALQHPLAERFVEASCWYGEALREETPGSTIVKAVTAMERLVMTPKPKKPNGDRDPSIKLVIAHRAALMQWKTRAGVQFKQLVSKMAWLYELRSRLTHGEVSPFDTEIASAAPDCLKFAEETLCAGLALFHSYNILPQAMTVEELGHGFDTLVEEARASSKKHKSSNQQAA